LDEVERTLIICIDSDNDIGVKGNVETPIVGRDRVLESATQLAVSDPEEADANAMFGAIKLYDNLIEQYPDEVFQVTTISGSQEGGVKADRKMVLELNQVLTNFKANSVILVTDGFSDEELVPIFQSRIPITSIHHVVVKHSERIEETWAVIFRYLKMLVEDPYYSRVSLGVPGVILVIIDFLLAANQMENAGMMVAFVLGLVLFLKGFGLDEKLAAIKLRLLPPERQLIMVSQGFGAILSLIGIYQGIVNALNNLTAIPDPFWNFSFWAGNLPALFGAFLLRGSDLIIIGIGIPLIGGIASYYLQKDIKIWQNFIGLIFLFWMRFILIESAKVLIDPEITLTLFSPLIFYTIVGVITTIISVAVIYRNYRKAFT
jgi:putative membrane protein